MAKMKDWKVTTTVYASAPAAMTADEVSEKVNTAIKAGTSTAQHKIVIHDTVVGDTATTNGEPMPG